MNKLKIEYIRLALAFLVFVYIVTHLFLYINRIDSQWFKALAELFTIPSLILIIAIPIWMIIDLVKKNIADKSILNLTFFISFISLILFGFAFIYLN